MTTSRVPPSLWAIALFQFVELLVLPPSFYAAISLPIALVLFAVFALLGVNLLRLKEWARVATVFLQGFSLIVRLLTVVSGAIPADGGPLDVVFVVTALSSMALSGLILYTIDLPDVQLLMQT